jgi:hypothetical protein
MEIASFLAKLQRVRKVGPSYVALCPAHEDHNASLSIAAGHEGRILLHCWAGCETAAVLAALGLAWSDLFPASPQSPRRRPRTSRRYCRRS